MVQKKTPKRDVDGILILDKPAGISSNRALQIAKRLFGAKKAGHTGSLDPLATGMLPLCFGQATKVSGLLLDSAKAYEVRLRFGSRSSTGDAEGEMVARSDVTQISETDLVDVIQTFKGDSEQVPPMYSALKQDGQRLYKLAREGKEVARKPRPIRIFDIRVVEYRPDEPTLFVHCSKGTYIRSLVEDIAEALGSLAYVTSLRRVWAEPFGEVAMLSLEELEAVANESGHAGLDKLLTSPDIALQHLAAVKFADEGISRLLQGQTARSDDKGILAAEVRMYSDSGAFIGIGRVVEADEEGVSVAPKRLFVVNRPD